MDTSASQHLGRVFGMINSKNKGARGERMFAAVLQEHGYEDARRGQQFSGSPDSPDVLGLPGHHIEVKFTEKLSIYKAIGQSTKDASLLEIPLVAFKSNGRPWLAILDMEDYLIMYRELEAYRDRT